MRAQDGCRSAFRLIISLALLLIGCATPHAELPAASPTPSDAQPSEASYVPGELIVKFKPDVRHDLPSLNTLFQQYGVSAIEPVFPGTHSPKEINAKFPERAKRAPEGSEILDLSTTYKLTLDPQADVLAAAAAFSADPMVEYAEPNRLMTIQSSEKGLPRDDSGSGAGLHVV